MHAIPTTYKNTQFRSRLEARWAAYFDLCGRVWEYEPIDLPGWIPDFLLRFTNSAGRERRYLVEVKPALSSEALYEFSAKIDAALPRDTPGIDGAILVGINPKISLGWYWPGKPRILTVAGGDIDGMWARAGNAVQWKAPR